MLFRIGVLIFVVLCITLFGYFISSAQDNVRRVEKTDGGEVMLDIKVADGAQDGSEPKTQTRAARLPTQAATFMRRAPLI